MVAICICLISYEYGDSITFAQDWKLVSLINQLITCCLLIVSFVMKNICAYRKQQKLSERKVSQFIGFHPNVAKTFAVFASSVWKKPMLN